MPKGFIIPAVPLIVIVLILAGAGIFYLNKSNISKVLPPTPSATITSSPSPTPDETANWKTFTNDIVGYSLKYPTDTLEACEDKHGTPFALENIEELANQQSKVIKSIRANFRDGECLPPLGGSGYSIEVWVRMGDPKSASEMEALSEDQGVQKITVDGTVGVLVTGRGTGNPPSVLGGLLNDYRFKHITVYKDGKIYSLYLNNFKYEKIFDQILSTFKFLETSTEDQFCGGIAGTECPTGYSCQLEGDYPDAGGKCVKL